jgi:hypothetical protein
LQGNADLGQALATFESFEVFGMQALNCDSNVNAVILEQPIDDREVALLGSQLDGVIRDVTALSSPSHGVVAVLATTATWPFSAVIDLIVNLEQRAPSGSQSLFRFRRVSSGSSCRAARSAARSDP